MTLYQSRHRIAYALVLILILVPFSNHAYSADSRSTTVWSGTVVLPDGYSVDAGEVLSIAPGTVVSVGAGYSIEVNGRIIVSGSDSSPVIFDSISGNHEGLIFNYSSDGLGSRIDNLSISNSKFGVTIYGSDPIISNLTVLNADSVAVDLYGGASPVISNLSVFGGGQDVHGFSTTWRYGIGLSIGAGSAPIVRGATIDGLITRGLNLWGNSGGLLSDLEISNISGSTMAISAGIWVEDSIPLIEESSIKRSDNGIFVRHITEGWTTRPTFASVVVEDSMYRGVMVEQYNHSQYSNLPLNAIFNDITVRGTGGPGAKTQGLSVAAFDINTSGVHIDLGLIEDNEAVGLRGYMIDSSTIINRLDMIRNGNPSLASPYNDRAGMFLRSANWAPTVNDLVVRNSTGPGVLLWKGGVQGSYWDISNNGATGLDIREFHPDLFLVTSHNNSGNGVSVIDSSNVELEQVHTSNNGLGSISASLGSGIYFEESNDVVSSGKNVSCTDCSTSQDQFGFVVRNSIDIYLDGIVSSDPVSGPALDIDNRGISEREGTVSLANVTIFQNISSYSIELAGVDAIIETLEIHGSNGGMKWVANGQLSSHLNSSIIRGNQGCLDLVDHSELISNSVIFECTGADPSVSSSVANFTDSFFSYAQGMSDTFSTLGNSHIRWISSSNLGTPNFSGSDNIVDVMWLVEANVINQNLRNIPYSDINITFSQYESEFMTTLPYSGRESVGPFIGQRWTPVQGWSLNNTMNMGCDYDGIHNDTIPMQLESDIAVLCMVEISNQPPFIIWTTPEDESVYPSGSTVTFNANESWDLDDDNLTYTWTSNIDGNLAGDFGVCGGNANGSFFLGNPWFSSHDCLSDGLHRITLEVCDDQGHCSTESRQIELTNLPPVLTVGTSPSISSWGTLYLGQTSNVTIYLSETYDPEEDAMICWATASYEDGGSTPPEDYNDCPSQIIRAFPEAPNQFSVTVYASDRINPPSTWVFNVELYNEIPDAVMSISRSGQSSSDTMIIDGSQTVDPEGDHVKFKFLSDLDGTIHSGISTDGNIEWVGTLSKGLHTITMQASDDRPGHAGQWTTTSQQVQVNNSNPISVISSPADGSLTDSGTVITLGSTGSGDWDIACADLPKNGSGLICNPNILTSTDLVSVLWESDIVETPLGSDWTVETRLPEGVHQITLTVDDGSGNPDISEIMLRVDESAPVLILDSPVPDVVVYSNLPVLFDFRRSFDADGDDFSVTITSDLMMNPILEDVTNDFWYNDYLTHGVHTLTIQLTDENGMARSHSQRITVLQTDPVALISGLSEGQYIVPGTVLELNGSRSFDYDNDITLYRWSLSDGTVLSDREKASVQLPPGPVRIDLLVQDSRGAQSLSSVNLTIGASSPTLRDMTVSPEELEMGVVNSIRITVVMEDVDGTTSSVGGEMVAGGLSKAFQMRDDGQLGDLVADDGIWTFETNWEVTSGSSASIGIWAVDDDTVSPTLMSIIPIVEDEGLDIVGWIAGSGLPVVIVIISIFIAVGMVLVANRRRQIDRDLEMIESWSTFDYRDPDDEV